MKKVWKWHIKDHEHLTLLIPKESKALKVGMQYGKVVIWIEVEVGDGGTFINSETVKREFAAYPTGGIIPQKSKHIDTIFDNGYVWHVYEVFND